MEVLWSHLSICEKFASKCHSISDSYITFILEECKILALDQNPWRVATTFQESHEKPGATILATPCDLRGAAAAWHSTTSYQNPSRRQRWEKDEKAIETKGRNYSPASSICHPGHLPPFLVLVQGLLSASGGGGVACQSPDPQSAWQKNHSIMQPSPSLSSAMHCAASLKFSACVSCCTLSHLSPKLSGSPAMCLKDWDPGKLHHHPGTSSLFQISVLVSLIGLKGPKTADLIIHNFQYSWGRGFRTDPTLIPKSPLYNPLVHVPYSVSKRYPSSNDLHIFP